jgi:hypothetical membrane protein
MRILQPHTDRIVLALKLAMVVPILYFGMQIVAAAFYPGYNFLNQDASTLGSPGSNFPAIFNGGAIIEGIVKWIVAWGFLRAFQQLGISSRVAWLTSLILLGSGLASIHAGIFPLPDPRHTASPLAVLNIGTIVLPFLIPAAVWKLCEGRMIRVYFIANIIAFIALIPIMTGLIQIFMVMAGVEWHWYQTFLNQYHGLIQRISAFIALTPLGVAGYLLAHRITTAIHETMPLSGTTS